MTSSSRGATRLRSTDLFMRVLEGDPENSRQAKASKLLLRNVSVGKMEKVWKALGRLVKDELKAGRCVNIPGFAKFGLAKATPPKKRPFFILNDVYAENFGLVKPSSGSLLSKAFVDVNFTKLSLETNISKDLIKTIISAIFRTLGVTVRTGSATVSLEFEPLGTIFAQYMQICFVFQSRRRSSNGFRSDRSNASVEFRPMSVSSSDSLSSAGSFTSESLAIVPRLDLGEIPEQPADIHISEEDGTMSCSTMSSSLPTIYPIYVERELFHDKFQARPEYRLDERVKEIDNNLAIEFERVRAELENEIEDCKAQDRDIARRNQISEMAYMENLLRVKQEQLDMNEFHMQQARERREREERERAAVREAGQIISWEENGAFPVDPFPDFSAIARRKYLLREALRGQMRDRKRRERRARVEGIAEERLLVDSNAKLLNRERKKREKKKEKEKHELRRRWEKQQQLAQMQKVLTKAKNGKVIAHSTSDGGMLTTRTATFSARPAPLPLDPNFP